MEIITKSDKETKKAGEILAWAAKKKKNKSLIIGLRGDLGGGKTTFTQGFAKGLGVKDKITSPTFVIFKKYSFDGGNFYHVDCYRIRDAADLAELDFNEVLKSDKNIVMIEWAEKIKAILPEDTIWMDFKYLNNNQRKITLFTYSHMRVDLINSVENFRFASHGFTYSDYDPASKKQ